MTNTTRTVTKFAVITFLLAALAAGVFTACAGVAARDNGLMPAVQLAWPGVKEDLDIGIAAAGAPPQNVVEAEARLDTAIKAGDRPGVKLDDWRLIRGLVPMGVSDRLQKGVIGQAVAESLMERVIRFDAALVLLNSK